MSTRPSSFASALFSGWLFVGCTGSILGSGTDPGGSLAGGGAGTGVAPVGGTPSAGSPATSACSSVGKTPQRLLTRSQLSNTFRDVFAPLAVSPDTLAALVAELPADEQSGGFSSNANAVVDADRLGKLVDAADGVAALVADGFAELGLGCSRGRTCAQQFLQSYGRLTYRRALAADEAEAMLTLLFDPEPDFAEGIRQLVRALLLSGDALYQYEVGADTRGALTRLSGYDLASKLSLLLWNTVPDDALLLAAERGELETATGFDAQVERLLGSQRVTESVGAFYRGWLFLEASDEKAKDETFTEAKFFAQLAETDRFATALTVGDGTFADLFMSTTAYVDPDGAALYGVPYPATAGAAFMGFSAVDLSPAQRAGILTRIGYLAGTSHATATFPTSRGRTLRSRVLCTAIPDPPADVQDKFPVLPVDPSRTARQILEEVTSSEARCAGCHGLMDPLGLTLEHYDALGRYREQENGKPIDSRTQPADLGDLADALALSRALADSAAAKDCYTESWYQYAFLRPIDEVTDACALEQLASDFASSGGSLRAFVLSLTRNPMFQFRAAE